MLAQADVDRELSRLGAGQEVREVESGEKRLLVYLLATIEQLVVIIAIWPAGPPKLMKPSFSQ